MITACWFEQWFLFQHNCRAGSHCSLLHAVGAVRVLLLLPHLFCVSAASTAFLADSQPPNRKALVVYPIFLFYFVISWMILTFTPQ